MYSSTTIVGNLSKDIALTYVPSGTAVAKTSIAYSDGFGENKKTHFIDVVVWGKTAEALNSYCKKGSKVLLVGVVQWEQWKDKDGSNRSKHSLRVEEMKMLDSKPNDGNSQQSQPKQYQKQVANIPEIDLSIDDDSSVPFNRG